MKLKKLIFPSLMLGLSFGLVSCNLDSEESDNTQTYTLPCANLIIPADGQSFATAANYNLIFYYLSEKVSVSTNNLSLGIGNTVGFTTSTMPYTTQLFTVDGMQKGVNKFSGGQANDMGALVQNLSGYTSSYFGTVLSGDPKDPFYTWTSFTPLVMSYTVNHDYTVKTFMPDAVYSGLTTVQQVGASSEPYVSPETRYRVKFTDNFSKATVIFYGAKFAEKMPVINFMIRNMDVTFTKTGYEISIPDGTSVIPLLYMDQEWSEAPNYPFTSFKFINSSPDLTVGQANYTVQVGPLSFNNTFSGSYVSDSKPE